MTICSRSASSCWSGWAGRGAPRRGCADRYAHRAAVAEFLTANHGENTSLGTELGVGYDDSPIVCTTDNEAPPWDRRTFVPAVDAAGKGSDAKRLLGEADLAPIRATDLSELAPAVIGVAHTTTHSETRASPTPTSSPPPVSMYSPRTTRE
jgi:hypothetical protein